MNSTSSTPLRAKSRVGGCRSLLFSLILLFFVSGATAQQQPSRTGNPAAAAASSSSARDNFPSNWRQIPTPPLPRWNAPKPKRIELANGMIIFLQEDHELPLINGYVTVREVRARSRRTRWGCWISMATFGGPAAPAKWPATRWMTSGSARRQK